MVIAILADLVGHHFRGSALASTDYFNEKRTNRVSPLETSTQTSHHGYPYQAVTTHTPGFRNMSNTIAKRDLPAHGNYQFYNLILCATKLLSIFALQPKRPTSRVYSNTNHQIVPIIIVFFLYEFNMTVLPKLIE